MKYRFLVLMLMLMTPLLGAGCAASRTDVDTHTYTVEIRASEIEQDTSKAELPREQASMQELLDATGVQADLQETNTPNAMRVSSLNGVLATLSKEWHLYINNILTPIIQLDHVPVRASDTIEWKYEKPITTNN